MEHAVGTVTVTVEFERRSDAAPGFELAAWFQYTCPMACRGHCPSAIADRLDIKLQRPRPATFVAVKLIDSEVGVRVRRHSAPCLQSIFNPSSVLLTSV